MNKINLFLVFPIIFIGLKLHAWKEVNNGAGISEQNLMYAKINAEEILTPLAKFLTIEEDTIYFKEWIRTLKQLRLEFNYNKHHRFPFLISGRNCLFYTEHFSLYDFDQNTILSIRESYHLLLEIFKKIKNLESDSFQNFKNKVNTYLESLETTLIIHSGLEQIQWTQMSESYLVFYAETEPIILTSNSLQERLCPERVSQLELNNPSLLRLQKSTEDISILLRVDSYFMCQGQMKTKSLLLDFFASEKDPKLKMR